MPILKYDLLYHFENGSDFTFPTNIKNMAETLQILTELGFTITDVAPADLPKDSTHLITVEEIEYFSFPKLNPPIYDVDIVSPENRIKFIEILVNLDGFSNKFEEIPIVYYHEEMCERYITKKRTWVGENKHLIHIVDIGYWYKYDDFELVINCLGGHPDVSTHEIRFGNSDGSTDMLDEEFKGLWEQLMFMGTKMTEWVFMPSH